MASKLVVFVVFAAVVQATFAASPAVEAARKKTHDSWSATVDTLYRIISTPGLDITTARSQYGSAATPGRQAILSVAKQGKNQALLKPLNERLKQEGDLLFASITAARSANPQNYASTIATINNNRSKVPLAEGVKGDFGLAESRASTGPALSALNTCWDNFFTGIRALAAFKAGKAKTIDVSSKQAANNGLSRYIDILYAQM